MGKGKSVAIGFWLTSFLAITARAEIKPIENYWIEAGLNFGIAESLVTQTQCYQSERTFLACGLAVSAGLSMLGKPLVAIPLSRLQEEGWKTPTETLGPVALIEPRPLPPQRSAAQAQTAVREERARITAAWTQLYTTADSVPVPFERLLKFIRGREGFEAHEALVSAIILNTLTTVTHDPHTMYLPQSYVQAQSAKGGKDFVGVGIAVAETLRASERVTVIKYLFENGPAHLGGVRAGDTIVSVDGEKTEGLSHAAISKKLTGEAGSTLVLGVSRKGEVLEFKLARRAISVPNVISKLLQNGSEKIGYVKLALFMQREGCEELGNAIENLEGQGAVGLVFDLRGNGGGLVSQGVCVANLFLGRGKNVVTIKGIGTDHSVQTHRTTQAARTKLPLVVLIDAGAASASEFVAAAVQDHFRGALVGERSYGKATVQNQSEVPGTQLYLRETVARFYRPSGITNQIAGVSPDLEVFRVPDATEDDKVASREEDQYMALPPLGAAWKQPREAVFGKVGDCVATAKPEAIYAAMPDQAVPPDYQLLYAEQTVRCLITLGVGVGDSVEPQPSWNSFTEAVLPGVGRSLYKNVQQFFQAQ